MHAGGHPGSCRRDRTSLGSISSLRTSAEGWGPAAWGSTSANRAWMHMEHAAGQEENVLPALL